MKCDMVIQATTDTIRKLALTVWIFTEVLISASCGAFLGPDTINGADANSKLVEAAIFGWISCVARATSSGSARPIPLGPLDDGKHYRTSDIDGCVETTLVLSAASPTCLAAPICFAKPVDDLTGQ